jgi:PTS system ascorbate-specific IIA component
MSAGLLLITHGELGQQLLNTATTILGHIPLRVGTIEVACDCDPDRVAVEAARLCSELDQGDGVLVLTDLFGSTPSNVAMQLLKEYRVLVLAGVNVPMLVRIFNYPSLPLEDLGNKASNGARDGVILTSRKKAS